MDLVEPLPVAAGFPEDTDATHSDRKHRKHEVHRTTRCNGTTRLSNP